MKNDALFVTTDNKYPTLARLASYYFEELQNFGVVTSSAVMTEEIASGYISSRLGFIHSFLQTLEMACGLRFAAGTNIPFCYNTAEWNKAAPIAGFTTPESAVLPSEVAMSLTLNGMLRARNALQQRLLKCALWQLDKTSLENAIEYLFDLHYAGFTGYNELFDVVAALLSGRSQAGSDEELLVRTLGCPAAEVVDWLDLEPRMDWISGNSLDAGGKAILSSLFHRASEQIERVRASGHLDEWIVGQAYIGGLLRAVRQLVELFIDKPPLAWRAQLSQWEEIEADAHGMMLSASAGYQILTPEYRIGYAIGIGHLFRNQLGDDWQERFYRERLLVPERLRRQLIFAEDLPMPTEWEHLSWRVIHPWTIGIENRELPLAARVKALSADELMDIPAVRQVMLTAGILERARQHQTLARYLNGEEDELTTALRQVLPADKDELIQELLLADLYILSQMNDNGEHRQAAQRAGMMIARYPYLAPAYGELAIALDRQGSPDLALDQLMAAIVLAPRDQLLWQSFGVVLNRLESGAEANFANGFHLFLASEEPQPSD